MKATRLLTHTAIVGCLLGATLMLGADPVVSSAEARGKSHQGPKYHKQHKQHHYEHHYRSHHRPVTVRHYNNHRARVRHHRPWHAGARRIYVHDSPFYFHAGLNVYLGGVQLGLNFTNTAPTGYVYVDPFCDLEFYSVDSYHRHLRRYPHHSTLWVAREVCAY